MQQYDTTTSSSAASLSLQPPVPDVYPYIQARRRRDVLRTDDEEQWMAELYDHIASTRDYHASGYDITEFLAQAQRACMEEIRESVDRYEEPVQQNNVELDWLMHTHVRKRQARGRMWSDYWMPTRVPCGLCRCLK